MKQDYPKIRQAGAELVTICLDSLVEHRRYGLALFGEELPFPYVSDSNLEIARCYSLLRNEEHPHGGFYYRSLWLVNREGVVTHKSLPWNPTFEVREYEKIFPMIGSEPGLWRPTQGLKNL